MSLLLNAHAYPLIRSGGLFLAIVGVAMIPGAFNMKRRYLLLGLGAALAAGVTTLLARSLTAPFGVPTTVQIGALAVAVAIEFAAFLLVPKLAPMKSERGRTLMVLAIVGLHFLIMMPAFGPAIAALGVLAMANSLVGAVIHAYPLAAVWALDGALKLGIGATMFWSAR